MKLRSQLVLLILVNGILFSHAQVPPYVPVSGLQGYWSFTGNANDVSGKGRHGTVYSASLTSDRFSNSNSAYFFNGGADIKTQYAGILGTNPRAVSFWARTSHSVTIMCGVAWGTIGTAARYEAGFNYGAPGPMLDGGNGVITYSPTVPAYDNNWHHYVMQFCSDSKLSLVQVYQDGILLTTTSNVYNGNNILNTINNFAVRFGSIPGSPDHYFVGDLDDIGIWDRCLSEIEIEQLYRSTNCPNNYSGRDMSSPCVSVAENQFAGSSLYPNPVTSVLTISGLPSGCTISVSDVNGKVLLDSKISTKGEIDFREFACGVYFLRIGNQGAVLYRKIIKA